MKHISRVPSHCFQSWHSFGLVRHIVSVVINGLANAVPEFLFWIFSGAVQTVPGTRLKIICCSLWVLSIHFPLTFFIQDASCAGVTSEPLHSSPCFFILPAEQKARRTCYSARNIRDDKYRPRTFRNTQAIHRIVPSSQVQYCRKP